MKNPNLSFVQDPIHRTWFERWSRILPLLMMGLVLLLSLLTAFITSRLAHEQQQVRFEREVNAHAAALQKRVADFSQLLQATRAFWLANPSDVTPGQFSQYGEVLNLTQRYPDIQALGYVAWVPSGQVDVLETMAHLQGIEQYRVKPVRTSWPVRAPIVLLVPDTATNRQAQGFDMYTEDHRRNALDRARISNTFQVTEPVSLVQTDRAGKPITGFLFMLPVWRSERVQTGAAMPQEGDLTGFLYMAVRTDTFLKSLEKAYSVSGIQATATLGTHTLHNQTASQGAFRKTLVLNMGGLDWRVSYAAPAAFGQDLLSSVPLLIIVLGLFLAGLAFLLTQSQVLAREAAEKANDSLKEAEFHRERSRAEFEAIFQSMQDAAAFTNARGEVRMVNRALDEQFKNQPGDLIGQTLAGLHLDTRLAGRRTFQAVTTPYRRFDGSQFYGEAQRTEVHGSDGQLLGLLEVIRDVSERVQAEQALQAEERRSRGVLDGIPHILWVSEPDGDVRYMNAQHRKRLGPVNFRECVHADDVATYDQMWQTAKAQLGPAKCEVRLHGTGKGQRFERWFEVRVAPLLADKGQAVEWVASATDIHDRLLAERLAQRNEERYRGVLEGMPQIVWLTDPQGEPTYFNRRWEEYVGQERTSAGFMSAIHPNDREDYQASWNAALRSGQPFEAEHRLLNQSGAYRTFVTRGLPLRDASGQVIEWVGTSTDVDDSVYAENAARLLADVSERITARVDDPLASRHAHYQAVMDLLTSRLMVAAAIWVSPQSKSLASSYHDSNWRMPHIQGFVRGLVRRAAASDEVVVIPTHPLLHGVSATSALVCPLIGLDGTLRGVLAVAFRQELRDRDHELVMELAKRLSTALDNDALRERALEAQHELQTLNQSLEERVSRRTRELQEANKELEAFSYSVSHDLRTPLRHILGFGDLLKKETQDSLSPKGTRYLGVMSDAANRMSTLIDSLLEFSRMGRQPLRTAPVELTALVENAWRNLETDRSGRHIDFELSPLPTVVGDAVLLDLVFQNLLSNAIKYSRNQPEARVQVYAEQTGTDVKITVRDNGAGFDPKYTERLFGVFQRLHTAEEFEGTGIGLANVRRIVTRHGGSVSAESQPGQGAAFHITLPTTPPEHP